MGKTRNDDDELPEEENEDAASVKASVVLTPRIQARMKEACRLMGDITFAKLVRLLGEQPLDFLLRSYNVSLPAHMNLGAGGEKKGKHQSNTVMGSKGVASVLLADLDPSVYELVNELAKQTNATPSGIVRAVVENFLVEWARGENERKAKLHEAITIIKDSSKVK